jgi:hypothetical protein
MRVEIVNDNQNWLNWGTLVQIWIADPSQRPTTVKELKDQMDAHNVCATVAGPDSRPVQIRSYINDPTDPLMIMLPNKQKADDRLATVKPGPYNMMPLFNDIAFGGAPGSTCRNRKRSISPLGPEKSGKMGEVEATNGLIFS